MEYLILGLLILSPMTGYELQQFIKKNLALICSHSAGSVQTALSKLEKEGKVTASETAEGKRRKKRFSITETGRTSFSRWVAQPMQADRVKNMELSRLFFCRPCPAGGTPCRDPGLHPADGRDPRGALCDPGVFPTDGPQGASAGHRLAPGIALSGIHHPVRHRRRRI